MTSMKKLIAAAVIGTISSIAVAQNIPEPAGMSAEVSAPGKKTVADVIQLTAKITRLNKETRRYTLVGPQGREINLTAGDDINLENIEVGDLVTVEYARSLTLELRKNGNAAVGRVETVSEGSIPVSAEEGGARVIDRMVAGVANVIAIDAETQTVTLQGQDNTLTLTVNDPEQFKLIEVGDQIEATFLEGAALSLTKQEAAE